MIRRQLITLQVVKTMKRTLIGIWALLFLSSSTELHELAKLPVLLGHYSQHHAQDHTMTFFDFLKLHYLAYHPNDNDDKNDNNLPFKSMTDLMHVDIPVLYPPEEAGKLFFFHALKLACKYTEGIPVKTSFSIFHPPRLA